MSEKIKTICLILIILSIIIGIGFCFLNDADASVKVKGYFRKNGTYVSPHYRSNPDSNPYNNWSFPGNYNPYTGEKSSGKVDTYLKNYYENKKHYIPSTYPSIKSYSQLI